MQHQSNNFRPQFSDEECITVYLWGISQRRFEQKTIYNYTKSHLLDWFPKLPSYAAFSRRLNALAPAFQALAELWLNSVADSACEDASYIVDSCPVILATGPRSGHSIRQPIECFLLVKSFGQYSIHFDGPFSSGSASSSL